MPRNVCFLDETESHLDAFRLQNDKEPLCMFVFHEISRLKRENTCVKVTLIVLK